MSFTSLDFLIFLPLLLVAVRFLPHRGQNLLLLAASYTFYGWVHPWFLWLIVGVTAANWLAAIVITRLPRFRTPALLFALTVSLGILGVFKYLDFFIANFQAVVGTVGMETSIEPLRLFLPVGISFYVFQGVGYAIDVWRGDLAARRNPLDVALFVSFFPQLVAGPIERAGNLLPQIERPREVRGEDVQEGLTLMTWGFFKKLVIADNTSLIVDKIFAVDDPTFSLIWVGVFAFAIQILADFSGYTDIARGAARLLGFRLVRNFDHPYMATSPGDFWRRWHMSLSFWLRDYLYIPLGGSRTSRWRAARNVLVTFVLCGFWHGASWNFVIWGAFHGLLVGGQRLLAGGPAKRRAFDLLAPVKIPIMFLVTCVGWLVFRETDIAWLGHYFTLSPAGESAQDRRIALYFLILAAVYGLPILAHDLFATLARHTAEGGRLRRGLAGLRVAAVPGLVLGIMLLRSPNPSSFIYFQF